MITSTSIWIIESRRRGKQYIHWHLDSIHHGISEEQAEKIARTAKRIAPQYDFRHIEYKRIASEMQA